MSNYLMQQPVAYQDVQQQANPAEEEDQLGIDWSAINKSVDNMNYIAQQRRNEYARGAGIEAPPVDEQGNPTDANYNYTSQDIAKASASSYSQYQYNLRKGDPNAWRKQNLEQATKRQTEILVGRALENERTKENLMSSDMPQEARLEQFKQLEAVNNMSAEERLDNYDRRKKGDPNTVEDFQFEQDMATKSSEELEALYGVTVADYAFQKEKQNLRLLADRTYHTGGENLDPSFFSTENFKDSGLSIIRKASDTIDSFSDLGSLALQGKDAIPEIDNGIFDNFSNWLREQQSTTHKNAEKRQATDEDYFDKTESDERTALLREGKTFNEAKSTAHGRRQWDQFVSAFDEKSTLYSQASEVLSDFVTGGIIAKGSAMLARGVSKEAVQKYVNGQVRDALKDKVEAGAKANMNKAVLDAQKAVRASQPKLSNSAMVSMTPAQRLASQRAQGTSMKQIEESIRNSPLIQKATLNQSKHDARGFVKAMRDKRDADVKGILDKIGLTAGVTGSTLQGSWQEASDAIGSTYDMVMSIDPDKLFTTKKGKEIMLNLMDEYDVNTYQSGLNKPEFAKALYEAQSELAKEASLNATKEVFTDSLLVNLASARGEAALGGLTTKVKGLKQQLLDSGLKTLGEMAEEYVESSSGERRPKESVNKVLETQIYDPDKQSTALGLKGALTAALGTGGVNLLPLGKEATVKTAKAVSPVVSKPINAINAKAAATQKQNNNNSFMSGVTGVSINPTPNTSSGSTGSNAQQPQQQQQPTSTIQKVKQSVQSAVGIQQPNASQATQQQLQNQFAQTHTGQVINSIATQFNNQIQANTPQGQQPAVTFSVNDPHSIVEHISNLNKNSEATINALSQKQNLTQDEQDKLSEAQNINQVSTALLDQIQEAYVKDIDVRVQETEDKIFEEIEKLNNAIQADPSLTPDQVLQKEAELQKQYDAQMDALQNLRDTISQDSVAQLILNKEALKTDQVEYSQFITKQQQATLLQSNLSNASISNSIQTFSQAINQIQSNPKLTASQKAVEKRKVGKQMIDTVKSIATKSMVTEDNAKESWRNLSSLLTATLDTLNRQDFGFEPNAKNAVVGLLEHIRDVGSNIDNVSDKEALTLMGKYVGTLTGGYKNRGNNGLLYYVQSALNNKGKLSPKDLIQLSHFNLTQEKKLQSLKALHKYAVDSNLFDPYGNVLGSPLTVANTALKTSQNQMNQDRTDETKFTTKHELESYIRAVEKDQQDFQVLVDRIFKTNKNKSGINGSRATVNTKAQPTNTNTGSTQQQQSTPTTPSNPTNTTNTNSTKPSTKGVSLSTSVKQTPSTYGNTYYNQGYNAPLNKPNAKATPVTTTPDPNGNVAIEEGSLANNLITDTNNLSIPTVAEDQSNDYDQFDLIKDEWSNSSVWVAPLKAPASIENVVTDEFKKDFLSLVQLPNGFKFTEQQWNALNAVNNFLNNPSSIDKGALTIAGYAGTGKSTIINYVFEYRQKKSHTPKGVSGKTHAVYVTPTHASGSVISTKTKTLYTTLNSAQNSMYHGNGIDPNSSLDKAITASSKFVPEISASNVAIVIDEVSMTDKKQLEKFIASAQASNIPVIMMGDPMQLPAVGENSGNTVYKNNVKFKLISHAFTAYPTLQLTEVMRTSNNDILNSLTAIRLADKNSFDLIPLPKEQTDSFQWSTVDTSFWNTTGQSIIQDFQNQSESTKVVAYTNSDVMKYNKTIRTKIFGRENLPLQVGEKLIGYAGNTAKKPISSGNKTPRLPNSLEYTVTDVTVSQRSPDDFTKVRVTFKTSGVAEMFNELRATENVIPLSDRESIHFGLDKATLDHNRTKLENKIKDALNGFLRSSHIGAHADARQYIRELTEGLGAHSFLSNYAVKPVFTTNSSGLYQVTSVSLVPVMNDSHPDYKELQEILNPFENKDSYGKNRVSKAGVNIESYYTLFGDDDTNSFGFMVKKGMDYGYAITTHKSQGMSIDNVYYVATKPKSRTYLTDDLDLNNADVFSTEANSLNYVGMSRASKKLHVIFDGASSYTLDENTKLAEPKQIKQTPVNSTPIVAVEDNTQIDVNKVNELFSSARDEEINEPYFADQFIDSNPHIATEPNKPVVVRASVLDQLKELRANNPVEFNRIMRELNLPVNTPVEQTQVQESTEVSKVNIYAGSNENIYASNLYPSPITFRGINFESVEHAYQALKQLENPLQDEIPASVLSWIENTRERYSDINKALQQKTLGVPNLHNSHKKTNYNLVLLKSLMLTRADTDIGFRNFLGQAGTIEFTHNGKGSTFIAGQTAKIYNAIRNSIISGNFDKTKNERTTWYNSLPSIKKKQENKEPEVNNTKAPYKAKTLSVVPIEMSVADVVKSNKWNETTAKFFNDNFREENNNIYRLQGISMFRNPKTGKISIDNVLARKSISFKPVESIATKHHDNYSNRADAEFVFSLNSWVNDVKDTLNSMNVLTSNVQNDLVHLNGSLQFKYVSKNQNGNPIVEYPVEYAEAIAKAIVESVSDGSVSSSSGSMVQKQLSDEGAYDLYIEELVGSDIAKTHEKSHADLHSQIANENNKAKWVEITNDTLSTLGTEKVKFISSLGKSVAKHLGISVNPNSQDVLDYEAFTHSLGVEAFNVMLQRKMLRTQRMMKVDTSLELSKQNSFTTIDFVSFKWDSVGYLANEGSNFKTRQTVRDIKSKNTDQITAMKLYNNFGTKAEKTGINSIADRHGVTNNIHLFRTLATITSEQGKEVFPDKSKPMRGISDKPAQVKEKDVANKTTSGKGAIAQSYVQAHNNLPFTFNTNKDGNGLVDVLNNEQNQEALLTFLGLFDKGENIPSVENSIESKSKGYQRELALVYDLLNNTPDKLADIYIKHKMISTQRVTMDSSVSPQALKIIRELLIPRNKKEDGSNLEYGFDISNVNDISEIIQEALDLIKTPYNVEDVDLTTDRYVNVTGYALALAQALDIKIENFTEQQSLEKLLDKVNNPDVRAMINTISANLKNGTPMDSKVLSKAEELGINTPRAFNALFTLAQIQAKQGLNSREQFQPQLFIEADGKGNGVHNNVRQFSVGFSKGYFDNLKRTGVVPLDLIAQELVKGKSLEQIEGTKHLFDKSNSEDILRDVYEAVADSTLNQLKNIDYRFLGNSNRSLMDYVTSGDYAKKRLKVTSALENTSSYDELLALREELNQLNLIASVILINELGALKGENIDLNKPFKELNFNEVARSLAKVAVTPSNYGGQLDGINNQLLKDVRSMYKDKVNEMYRLAIEGKYDEDLNNSYKALNQILGYNIKHATLPEYPTKEEFKAYFENMVNFQKHNGHELTQNLKFTLAPVLSNSIDEIYGEQFAMVRAIISIDNALFSNFLLEFQDNIRNAIDKRNKENNWIDSEGNILDPRALNYLSKQEIRSVLNTLNNLPHVATAMSGNTALIDELIDSGNSITQELRGQVSKQNTALVYSTFLNNTAKVFVQSQFRSTFDSYKSAGASLLTSSIVSTEASVQGRLIQELAKENIATLDVYDGIETLPIYRFKVGKLANNLVNGIHQNTSLVANFYEYALRGNLHNSLFQAIQSPNWKDTFKSFNEHQPTIRVSGQTLQAIQTVLGSVGFMAQFYGNLPKEMKEAKQIEAKSRELLSNLINEISLTGNSFENATLTLNAKDQALLSDAMKLTFSLRNVVPEMLDLYRQKAVENKVLHAVEKEFLPAVINQFGGINNGYVHFPKEAQDTLNRFIEFVNKGNYGDISDLALKSSSKVLEDFMKQDKIINKRMIELRRQFNKQLPSAKLNSNEVTFFNPTSEITDSDTLISEIQNHVTSLNQENKGNSLTQYVEVLAPALINLMNDAKARNNGQSIRVTTDKESLVPYLNQDEVNHLRNPNVQAFYSPRGIYIPKMTQGIKGFEALHELIHYGLNDYIYTFYADSSRLNEEKASALRLMEAIAIDMSAKFTNDSRFIKVYEAIKNTTGFHPDNAYILENDRLIASMANIQWVFSKEFEKNNSPQEVAYARAKAMQEFTSYGLTTLNMLNYMKTHKLSNREATLQSTGFKAVLESLEEALNKLFKAFLQVFGYKNADKSNGLNRSYLADYTRAIQVLSMDNTSLVKDNSASSAINTTSFNGRNYVNTKDAINALGSSFNRDDYKARMFNLYETVNSQLEKPIYKSYTQAYADIRNNTYNQEAIQALADLRSEGFKFTPLEENMFKLMRSVNKASLDNNHEFTREAVKLVNDILSNVPKRSSNKLIDALASRPLEEQLALIQTHEVLGSMIEPMLSKKKVNIAERMKAVGSLYKHLSAKEKNLNQVDQLGAISAKLLFDGQNSLIVQQKQANEAWRVQQQKNNASDFINDLAKDLPNKYISNALRLAATEFFSGISEREPDTHFEKALSKLADNSALLANRPTVVSKLIKLFLGAMQHTQYIYSMQNRASILAEAAREKLGVTVNASIEKEFGRKLKPEEHKALSSGYFNGNLAFIRTAEDALDVSDILKDDVYRRDARRVLMHKLMDSYSNYPANQQAVIKDFIEWQIAGLAEMNMTGKAKSLSNSSSSYILPNTRAIANLGLLNKLEGINKLDVKSNDFFEAEKHLNAILALDSVNHMSQETKDTLLDLFKNNNSAMKMLETEHNLTYSREYTSHAESLSGYSNFKHHKANNNKDYQLVEPKDSETINRLSNLGYEFKGKTKSGLDIYATNQSLMNNYTTGILSLTEMSVNGASISDGLRLNGKGKVLDTSKKDMYAQAGSVWKKVKANEYASLSGESSVEQVLDYAGNFWKQNEDLPFEQREHFTEITEDSYEHLGNRQARQIEELTVERNNDEYIKTLHNAYINDKDKSKYILLDGNYKPKGTSKEDLRFATAFNNFYDSLPIASKKTIENLGGLYINRSEVDNIIGYSQASITDMFTGKSGLPEPIQNAFVATMNALIKDATGKSPAKFLKQFERLKSELATLAKDYVLNRSFVVPAQNLLSNVIHLAMLGIPVNKIPSYIIQSYNEVKEYQNYEREMLGLIHKLETGKYAPVELKRIQGRITLLQNATSKMRVNELIKEGIFTNITQKENGEAKDDFSILNSLGKKTGITSFRDKLPTLVKEGLVFEGTKVHNVMEEFMNYGDFVAKYALYRHLTETKGVKKENAIAIIRDEFVNYSVNRGREFDWLNKVGLTWFLAYRLSIQRIIYRSLRRNTLRTLAVWNGANVIKEANIPAVSSLVQTVPQQRLWTDYSGYNFELDNMVDSFTSHWLSLLL